jgi:hypothetical protein
VGRREKSDTHADGLVVATFSNAKVFRASNDVL